MRATVVLAGLLLPIAAFANDQASVGKPLIKASQMGIGQIVYEVTNHTDQSINVVVKCSLYDGAGAPLGEAGGWVKAIPANGKAVSERPYLGGEPARAECRVTDITQP